MYFLDPHSELRVNNKYPSSELVWAVYGFIQALENTSNKEYQELAQKWQTWMDYTKTTAAKVYHDPLLDFD
jgi:hypothetical protein